MNGATMAVALDLPAPDGTIRFAFTDGGGLDHVAALVAAHGLAGYEAPTPAVFAGVVRGGPVLVLDIGASSGLFTLLAAAANPLARVVAFEPLGAARRALDANIACNPELAHRILVGPFALSSSRGVTAFFETINDRGLISTSSSLEQAHAMQVGPYVRREVGAATLDDWMAVTASGPDRLIMKIDAEGHEHAVIVGGRTTIARHRPLIFVEVLGGSQFGVLDAVLVEHSYYDFALALHELRECPRVSFQPDAWNHLLCPIEQVHAVVTICDRLGLRIAGRRMHGSGEETRP